MVTEWVCLCFKLLDSNCVFAARRVMRNIFNWISPFPSRVMPFSPSFSRLTEEKRSKLYRSATPWYRCAPTELAIIFSFFADCCTVKFLCTPSLTSLSIYTDEPTNTMIFLGHLSCGHVQSFIVSRVTSRLQTISELALLEERNAEGLAINNNLIFMNER